MNKIKKFNPGLIGHIAEALKALGHPHRLRILEALSSGEKSVGEIQVLLSIPQAVVSQQLRIMRTSQLVLTRRKGSLSLYRVAHAGLINLLNCLYNCQETCVIPQGNGDSGFAS